MDKIAPQSLLLCQSPVLKPPVNGAINRRAPSSPGSFPPARRPLSESAGSAADLSCKRAWFNLPKKNLPKKS